MTVLELRSRLNDLVLRGKGDYEVDVHVMQDGLGPDLFYPVEVYERYGRVQVDVT